MEAYDHLNHLERCQTCNNQRLTIPLLCSGHQKPENTGAWYQKCLDNPGNCQGFRWCSVPRGPKPDGSRAIECHGRLCLQRTKSRTGNTSCHYGFCQHCCILAHQEQNPPLSPCADRRHNTAFLKASSATDTVTITSGGVVSPLPAPSRSPEKMDSYAVPLSNTYQQRLHALDNEHLERVAGNSSNQSHSRQLSKTVTIKWWTSGEQDPETMNVVAPDHPHFHPKHSNHLVALYQVDQKMFETFDLKQKIWMISSSDTPAQSISGTSVLYYRSRGVRNGPGMPGVISRTEKTTNRSRDPIIKLEFTGKHDIIEVTDSDDEHEPSPPSSLNRPYMPNRASSNHNMHTPPPPSSSVSPSPTKSSTSALVTPDSLNTKSAPAGPHRWPLKYVVDMANGFAEMDTAGTSASARSDTFSAVFGTEYKRTTYNDNRRAWDLAREDGKVETWIKAGRSKDGLWTTFYSGWKQRSRR